jgi:enoyl-CoA hydratase
MDDDHILYEVTDKVGVITLNRPQRANARPTELLDDLDAAWSRAACDDEVKVIVLRANGRHFSSGRARAGADECRARVNAAPRSAGR